MRKGEIFKSKFNNRKWTIISFDKKKQIVKSISGKQIKKSNYIYFMSTHEKI